MKAVLVLIGINIFLAAKLGGVIFWFAKISAPVWESLQKGS